MENLNKPISTEEIILKMYIYAYKKVISISFLGGQVSFSLCKLFPTNVNNSALQKWLIPGPGQGRYKVSLKSLVLKCKEAFKDRLSNL